MFRRYRQMGCNRNYPDGLWRLRPAMISLVICWLCSCGLFAQAPPGAQSQAADWKRAGMAAVSARKLESALAAFEKACSLDPADEDNCYFLGRTFFLLDRWAEAQTTFEKALSSAPKAMQARLHRATALNLIALNQPAEAERHFREAIALYPGPEKLAEDPRVDYGAFLFRQARMEEALSVLGQAAAAAPKSARAHAELGRVLLHLGRADEAIKTLEKAVALDPGAAPVRLLLGRACLLAGRTEEGERYMQQAQRALSAAGSSTVR